MLGIRLAASFRMAALWKGRIVKRMAAIWKGRIVKYKYNTGNTQTYDTVTTLSVSSSYYK